MPAATRATCLIVASRSAGSMMIATPTKGTAYQVASHRVSPAIRLRARAAEQEQQDLAADGCRDATYPVTVSAVNAAPRGSGRHQQTGPPETTSSEV
jgi:hypothetical protein